MCVVLRIVFTSLAILVLCAAPTQSTEASTLETGWARLKEPGTVAIMRHAIAPGTGDPGDFRIGDCSTQRNLDERGREQARRIGAAVRASGAKIDRILSSQWCRCVETAKLLEVGTVEQLASLNSFFEDRSTESAQTEALRVFLNGLSDDETVLLVTHQVNITALTGVFPASGEVVLFRMGADGTPTVLERIRTGS
ncbi:histidine phosphatase family protein [Nisaea sp.]|uniref:histidine phosphatase family protein n=1 Tax=Nisaea sp. TaxID=2024842 RepID=UPI003264010A